MFIISLIDNYYIYKLGGSPNPSLNEKLFLKKKKKKFDGKVYPSE